MSIDVSIHSILSQSSHVVQNIQRNLRKILWNHLCCFLILLTQTCKKVQLVTNNLHQSYGRFTRFQFPRSLLFSSIITPFEQIFISNLQSLSPYNHNMGNWLPLTPKTRSIKVSNGNTLLIYCENYHYLSNKTCVLGQWFVYFQGSCFECQPH